MAGSEPRPTSDSASAWCALARFGIGSRSVRTGTAIARCYVRVDFDDAFSRYLPDQFVSSVRGAESATNLTESEPSRLRLVTVLPGQEMPCDLAGVADVTDATSDVEAAHVALERAAIKEFGS